MAKTSGGVRGRDRIRSGVVEDNGKDFWRRAYISIR